MAELDHVIIHIDDWESSAAFYTQVLGVEVIDNPEGAANPLGSVAYRLGDQQINVHGPWPGKLTPCCPAPLNAVGAADLAFRVTDSSTETVERLLALGIEIIDGPIDRFGANGWGQSIYCRDPSGNGIELITYQPDGVPSD